MARKVFISVLGTSIYGKCKYVSENFKSSNTRFIQQATLEWLNAKLWDKDDKAFIFLTEESKVTNWEVLGNTRKNFKGEIIDDYHGLEEELKKMDLPFEVNHVTIPDGKDEDEIWSIFQVIYGEIYKQIKEFEAVELYFDFTHGFRYLPMLILVLGNYAKFLLDGIQVMSMSYGNYEARDRIVNEAPIVNLMPLAALQDWTFAVADYKLNGYVDWLNKMSVEELRPILRDDQRRTEDVKVINKLIKKLTPWSQERLYCRGLDVVGADSQRIITNLLSKVSKVVIPPLKPLLDYFRQTIGVSVKTNSIVNMFDAARWCYEHNQFQQSVTFLEEGVISFFCLRHGIPLNDEKKRDVVTSAFFIKIYETPLEEQRVSPKNRALLDSLLEDDMLNNPLLVKSVGSLIGFRNDYNHCGMRSNPAGNSRFLDISKKLYQEIVEILYENKYNFDSPSKQLFVNFSNHSSQYWNDSQIVAAQEYGEIIDIEFPAVDPKMVKEDIFKLVDDNIQMFIPYAAVSDLTVHIMGEMTFTYLMVQRLKSLGIRCVASTTERVVEEHDGIKTSEFRFVRFREY